MWALQRQLLFFPDASAVPPAGQVTPGAQDVTLHTADGLALGAWFVAAAGDRRGHAVLLAPGNGGNRLGRASLAERLSERGFAVLVMDYRGYGGNPGSPSEKGIVMDADAAVVALRSPVRSASPTEVLRTGPYTRPSPSARPGRWMSFASWSSIASTGCSRPCPL